MDSRLELLTIITSDAACLLSNMPAWRIQELHLTILLFYIFFPYLHAFTRRFIKVINYLRLFQTTKRNAINIGVWLICVTNNPFESFQYRKV